jgi:plasmid stabilization system protein ParE
VVDKLTHRSEQLIHHPHSGRLVPEYENMSLRELIVFPYRLVYRIKPDRLDVIAVFHGAQQPPESL